MIAAVSGERESWLRSSERLYTYILRLFFLLLLVGALLGGREGPGPLVWFSLSESPSEEGEEGGMYRLLFLLGRPALSIPEELSETA